MRCIPDGGLHGDAQERWCAGSDPAVGHEDGDSLPLGTGSSRCPSADKHAQAYKGQEAAQSATDAAAEEDCVDANDAYRPRGGDLERTGMGPARGLHASLGLKHLGITAVSSPPVAHLGNILPRELPPLPSFPTASCLHVDIAEVGLDSIDADAADIAAYDFEAAFEVSNKESAASTERPPGIPSAVTHNEMGSGQGSPAGDPFSGGKVPTAARSSFAEHSNKADASNTAEHGNKVFNIAEHGNKDVSKAHPFMITHFAPVDIVINIAEPGNKADTLDNIAEHSNKADASHIAEPGNKADTLDNFAVHAANIVFDTQDEMYAKVVRIRRHRPSAIPEVLEAINRLDEDSDAEEELQRIVNRHIAVIDEV